MTAWFIVANRHSMQVFKDFPHRPGDKLREPIHVLLNPMAREPVSGIAAKEIGQGVRTAGKETAFYYSKGKEHDPQEDVAWQFAREIADFIDLERNNNSFTTITIAAEPRFQGILKKCLSTPSLRRIQWIGKRLGPGELRAQGKKMAVS